MDDVQNKRGFWALNFLQKRSRLKRLLRLQTFPRGRGCLRGRANRQREKPTPEEGEGGHHSPLKEHCDRVRCVSTLPRARGYREHAPLFLFEPGVCLLFLCFPMECGSCRGRLLASGFAACRKPKAVVRCGSGVFMQEELESLGARVWTGGARPPTRHKLRFPELVLPCTPFPHGFQACLQDLLWPADTSSRDPSRGPTGPVT